jgi:serine/threonine protein kinase
MEGKCFEEAELWYLVFSIIHAADAFHASGKKVGDVRPLNVFISPEGQVRVATQLSWPNEQTNYLSPEELKDISYGKLEESANFALNEAFSVGLTCLDAATLTDSATLYEPNNKFNYAKLDQRLEQLESNGNYSAPLVLLVKALCQVEGEKRVTCKELAEWLSKYENSIIELQDFSIAELPEKLHKLSQSRVQTASKMQPPQQLPYQYQGQFAPQLPPANFISAPVNRS